MLSVRTGNHKMSEVQMSQRRISYSRLSMFQKCFSVIAVGFLTLFLSAGCKFETITADGSGSLRGTVTSYDVDSTITLDPSGVTILLEGTSLHTTSDNQGKFEIDNIAAGVYNVIFLKDGFDSMIYPTLHLHGVGTEILNDAFVIKESVDTFVLDSFTPTFRIDSSRSDTTMLSLAFSGHLIGSDAPPRVKMEISHDSSFTKLIELVVNSDHTTWPFWGSKQISIPQVSIGLRVNQGERFYFRFTPVSRVGYEVPLYPSQGYDKISKEPLGLHSTVQTYVVP
jgi:hypothetical protein